MTAIISIIFVLCWIAAFVPLYVLALHIHPTMTHVLIGVAGLVCMFLTLVIASHFGGEQ